jgi:arylsulfatase A-like enzyme
MDTTPKLDKWASENVMFQNVTSQCATTAPSHKSIFYSVYPSIHKTTIYSVPEEKIESPVEILKAHGFKTVAFTSGGQMSKSYGFSKGFDDYWEPSWQRKTRIRDIQDLAFDWLDKNYNQKFFLFLHTFEVHCPYDPPKKFFEKYAAWYHGRVLIGRCRPGYFDKSWMKEEDYRFVQNLYAGEVNYMDTQIGNLFQKLKKLGIYDQTMVIFLADHGESLGEHKYIGHNELYQVQLHVPLIMHIPTVSATAVDGPAELIDVMPTIFEAVGINRTAFPFQGKNLLPAIKHQPDIEKDRALISEEIERARVRKGDFTVIFSPGGGVADELYDLKKDPEEVHNLAKDRPDLVKQLKIPYFEVMDRSRALSAKFSLGKSSKPNLSEETREQLKALGYVMP